MLSTDKPVIKDADLELYCMRWTHSSFRASLFHRLDNCSNIFPN